MRRAKPAPLQLKSRERQVGWHLTLYLDAREAAGIFRTTVDFRVNRRDLRGESLDPERSKLVADSRACTKMRRFVVAHRLNRLGTLTYAGEGCHDPVVLRRHVGEFFRQLRTVLGGEAFPYLWVPEWHPGGHGLHVHFAVGQYVKRSLIEQAWGRGFVHIKLLGDLPVGSTTVDEARAAAGYLAKYVGKAIDNSHVAGLHRYEVAQGFKLRTEKLFAVTLDELLALATERMGAVPREMSTSDTWASWTGPTAVAMTWAV
ncbi:MAG TPA: hypothetical protein VIH95_08350 [Acidimicrobiales bacterium]